MIHYGNLEKKLSNDKAYCLCMIARIHKIPLNLIIESEQILASEFAQSDNHVWQPANIEALTIAVLKFVCNRHNFIVDFDTFITRVGIREQSVNMTYTRLSGTYKDGHMPRMTVPSTTVFTILSA